MFVSVYAQCMQLYIATADICIIIKIFNLFDDITKQTETAFRVVQSISKDIIFYLECVNIVEPLHKRLRKTYKLNVVYN